MLASRCESCVESDNIKRKYEESAATIERIFDSIRYLSKDFILNQDIIVEHKEKYENISIPSQEISENDNKIIEDIKKLNLFYKTKIENQEKKFQELEYLEVQNKKLFEDLENYKEKYEKIKKKKQSLGGILNNSKLNFDRIINEVKTNHSEELSKLKTDDESIFNVNLAKINELQTKNALLISNEENNKKKYEEEIDKLTKRKNELELLQIQSNKANAMPRALPPPLNPGIFQDKRRATVVPVYTDPPESHDYSISNGNLNQTNDQAIKGNSIPKDGLNLQHKDSELLNAEIRRLKNSIYNKILSKLFPPISSKKYPCIRKELENAIPGTYEMLSEIRSLLHINERVMHHKNNKFIIAIIHQSSIALINNSNVKIVTMNLEQNAIKKLFASRNNKYFIACSDKKFWILEVEEMKIIQKATHEQDVISIDFIFEYQYCIIKSNEYDTLWYLPDGKLINESKLSGEMVKEIFDGFS